MFRGDGRAPDLIFQKGFQPQGLNQDLYRYATENVESVFVSASKSPRLLVSLLVIKEKVMSIRFVLSLRE